MIFRDVVGEISGGLLSVRLNCTDQEVAQIYQLIKEVDDAIVTSVEDHAPNSLIVFLFGFRKEVMAKEIPITSLRIMDGAVIVNEHISPSTRRSILLQARELIAA